MIRNPHFEELEDCLLRGDKPSVCLREFAKQPWFREFPFSLLLAEAETKQSPQHHPEGDVWTHTLMVVDEAAKRKRESADPRVFMWTALLHDIGKPSTTQIRGGKITAYDHDKAGAELAARFLSALGAEETLIERVVPLVRYHMQPLFVEKGMPRQDLPGLLTETNASEVALLGYCDRVGRGGADREAERQNIRRFLARCREGGRAMAKAGMRRPDPSDPHGTESNKKPHFPKNEVKPVPELQGKAKTGKRRPGPA